MNKTYIASILISMIAMLGELSHGLPTLGKVEHGAATIHQNSHAMTIQQSTPKAIINWQSFNIAAKEAVHFNQPSINSVALNRINPNQGASQIAGSLSSNGRIILINSAGIHFGTSAMVNVGGIIASTSNISNANFFADKYIFDQPSTHAGSVINHGNIAAKHGLVALIGTAVENHGIIQAQAGTIALGSGNKFTLDFHGDQLINFNVDESTSIPGIDTAGKKLAHGVNNKGKLLADGGRILVTAKSASGVLDNVINMDGVAQAQSVSQHNGVIILNGDSGSINVSSQLIATSSTPKVHGGKVKIYAKNVKVQKSAVIDVSGSAGNGNIVIEANSNNTIEPKAVLKADATLLGKGGNITIASEGSVNVHGSLSAKGGPNEGDGGYVKTIGSSVDITGAEVNLTSTSPKNRQNDAGTWLIKANNMHVNSHINSSNYTQINVNTLENNLHLANIKLVALSNETNAGDIIVNSNITWNAPTTLTLSAYRNIDVLGAVISNPNHGNLILEADNSQQGTGQINFIGQSPQIQMGNGKVIIYSSRSPMSQYDYSNDVSLSNQASEFLSINNNYGALPLENEMSLSDAESDDEFAENGGSWLKLSHPEPESWIVIPDTEKPLVQLTEAELLRHSDVKTASLTPIREASETDSAEYGYLSESDFELIEKPATLSPSIHSIVSDYEIIDNFTTLNQSYRAIESNIVKPKIKIEELKSNSLSPSINNVNYMADSESSSSSADLNYLSVSDLISSVSSTSLAATSLPKIRNTYQFENDTDFDLNILFNESSDKETTQRSNYIPAISNSHLIKQYPLLSTPEGTKISHPESIPSDTVEMIKSDGSTQTPDTATSSPEVETNLTLESTPNHSAIQKDDELIKVNEKQSWCGVNHFKTDINNPNHTELSVYCS